MMNIAMAKTVVAFVEITGATASGRDLDDVERARAAMAAAAGWSPWRRVLDTWQVIRGRVAPAKGARTADVAFAATAIAGAQICSLGQGVVPSQAELAGGLGLDRPTIDDRPYTA